MKHISYLCDSCGKDITTSRIQLKSKQVLTVPFEDENDFGMRFDLCEDCMSRFVYALVNGGFLPRESSEPEETLDQNEPEDEQEADETCMELQKVCDTEEPEHEEPKVPELTSDQLKQIRENLKSDKTETHDYITPNLENLKVEVKPKNTEPQTMEECVKAGMDVVEISKHLCIRLSTAQKEAFKIAFPGKTKKDVIAELHASGMSNSEIAKRCYTTKNTVSFYISQSN